MSSLTGSWKQWALGHKPYLSSYLGGRNWQRTCFSLEIIFLNKFSLAVWTSFSNIVSDSSFWLTFIVVSQDSAYPLLLLVPTKLGKRSANVTLMLPLLLYVLPGIEVHELFVFLSGWALHVCRWRLVECCMRSDEYYIVILISQYYTVNFRVSLFLDFI